VEGEEDFRVLHLPGLSKEMYDARGVYFILSRYYLDSPRSSTILDMTTTTKATDKRYVPAQGLTSVFNERLHTLRIHRRCVE
jgi:hypothetical protein